jgi:hypothetical protein
MAAIPHMPFILAHGDVTDPVPDRHAPVWSRHPPRRTIEPGHDNGGVRMYGLMGLAHARMARAGMALRDQRGQGTVEYVALILLVALVMAGVVAAMKGFKTDDGKELGDLIIAKIKEAVRKVQF